MTDNVADEKSSFKPKRPPSVMWKVVAIAVLIVSLLIPLTMISGVIAERQDLKRQVEEEIASTWGGEQTLTGPILAVPYKSTEEITAENGQAQKKIVTVRRYAYLLPQQYRLTGEILPEVRYRGIYKSIVYTSQLTAKGYFKPNVFNELKIPRQDVLWKEAFVVIALPHTKGIQKRPVLQWQGKSLELLPGVNGASVLNTGLYADTAVNLESGTIPFELKLSLNGSETFSVVPIGKDNTIQLSSKWPSPSFIGNTLPTNRTVQEKGFTASWEVPYFARSYPQTFTDAANYAQKISDSQVGVSLLTPVDFYRQSERAIKYGVLFLVLTFATYFLFEVVCRHRIHPFQYLLVGCALCLFYLLLIAFSEVIGFNWAYLIGSVAVISIITFYSQSILGKVRQAAHYIIGGMLAVLYSYLYILLQLEDLSLLFGTIGLFTVLAVIMYVTRNIDWYNEQVA